MFIRLLYYLLILPVKRRIKAISGWENIPRTGPAILAANHIDYLDGWLLSILLLQKIKRRVHFIAKSKNYFWMKDTTISIEDHGPKESLNQALEFLKQGKILILFPEGQRNSNQKLLKGKTGAARLALWSKCLVIPIGLTGSSYRNLASSVFPALFCPKAVAINIGRAIDLRSYYNKDITYDLLTDCTRTIMFEIGRLCGKEYVY